MTCTHDNFAIFLEIDALNHYYAVMECKKCWKELCDRIYVSHEKWLELEALWLPAWPNYQMLNDGILESAHIKSKHIFHEFKWKNASEPSN